MGISGWIEIFRRGRGAPQYDRCLLLDEARGPGLEFARRNARKLHELLKRIARARGLTITDHRLMTWADGLRGGPAYHRASISDAASRDG